MFLIDSANPLSGMTLVWEGDPFVHCIVEHHQGYLYLFTDAARGGQPTDNHYILRSSLDVAFDKRIWEVCEVSGLCLLYCFCCSNYNFCLC